MQILKKELVGLTEYVTNLRRDFHRYPELSNQEFRTASRIEEELSQVGIPSQRIGKTGVLGILSGPEAPKHAENRSIVALRADIDALPVQEVNSCDYASENPGVMHACGHDFNTACLLTAAKILAKRREFIRGEVRFFFQPAEETGGGASDFINAGALENVKQIFGIHVAPDLPAGFVGLKPGLNNAAVDAFRVQITGKSVHVSTPQLGVDALYIACQTIVALQAIVTRCISPVDAALIGVGKLQSGTTYNALAAFAEFEGTTRTITQALREQVRRQITQVVQQTASLYGGTVDISWTDCASALYNHPESCQIAAQVVEELFGVDHIITDRALSLGGDNFAEYLLNVPGAYAYLGTANPLRSETQYPVHSDHFDLDESVLTMGAGLYAGFAWKLVS